MCSVVRVAPTTWILPTCLPRDGSALMPLSEILHGRFVSIDSSVRHMTKMLPIREAVKRAGGYPVGASAQNIEFYITKHKSNQLVLTQAKPLATMANEESYIVVADTLTGCAPVYKRFKQSNLPRLHFHSCNHELLQLVNSPFSKHPISMMKKRIYQEDNGDCTVSAEPSPQHFCDICHEQIGDTIKHRNSCKHQNLLNNQSKWERLDQLIAEMQYHLAIKDTN